MIFGPASPLRVQVNDRCCGPFAYWSSDRATWGSWLAWESMATPACCRIWDLVRLAVSAAKSASRIRERAAEMFSDTFCRLEMVDSNRFWTAPRPGADRVDLGDGVVDDREGRVGAVLGGQVNSGHS